MGDVRNQPVKEVRTFYDTPAPQTITTDTASAACASAFGHDEIIVTTTTDGFFKVAATPVASAADHFMTAGSTWPLRVDPTHKLAFISPGGAGVVYISAVG